MEMLGKWDVLWRLNEDKAIIQVFEGTDNMSLVNTHTKTYRSSNGSVCSPDMLGVRSMESDGRSITLVH